MVLDDNDMLNITFEVIKEQPGDKTAFELMQKCCNKIKEKVNSQIDTQEICDDVCNCMDYYNDNYFGSSCYCVSSGGCHYFIKRKQGKFS